jgi:hypothetical protein
MEDGGKGGRGKPMPAAYEYYDSRGRLTGFRDGQPASL